MELTHPSSAEEVADSIHLYVEPASNGTTEKIEAPVSAPAVVKTPNVASPVLSPFCESLIYNVRNQIGFGKVNTSRQDDILIEFLDDKELAGYEVDAVRNAIQFVLIHPVEKKAA